MENKLTNAILSRRSASQLLALGSASAILHPWFRPQKTLMMKKRTIPGTEEKIPVVGLGTWQTFDVGPTAAERDPLKAVLEILVKHGGSVIDSSPMYGRSEEVVGDLTTALQVKDKIYEATKVWTTGEAEGIHQMNTSIKLMKADPIDLMQIHNLQDWRTHIKTLRQWKEEKKIRHIGITHYHKGGYEEMEKIMTTEQIDFIQINYNAAVRDAAERILPLAQNKGIAVLINRPFEGGALFRSVKGADVPQWVGEFGAQTWGQIFLKYILSHPAVTCVIPGTSKAKHMLDNVQAGFGDLPTARQQKEVIKLLDS